MKKSGFIILFFTALAADLFLIYRGDGSSRYFTKPLLMILLAACFISGTKGFYSPLKKWIILALVFSWGGDVLLMFEPADPNFFIFGLSSFLMAHLFYIFFFHAVRVRESVKSNVLLLLAVVVYYAVFISILSPYLGKMKLPVRIYGVVISFMLMLALHTLFIQNKRVAEQIIFGAVLFVISDSMLAINKFYYSFSYAGIFVMLTYGMAQFLIVNGAISYIRNTGSGALQVK